MAALSRALGPLRTPAPPLWIGLFLVATGSQQSLAQPLPGNTTEATPRSLRASGSLCGPHAKAPYLCEATHEPAAARIRAQVPDTRWSRVGGQRFYSRVLSPLHRGPSGHTEASAQRSHMGKLKEPQPQDHKPGLGAS
jgi:hypothetical protein|uniref:Putative uncharacterized protein UNQ9165/PRO28630 n=1 Tax=Homo sapiens TaxID=9606 RepID=YS002_HUMAN|nr:RecName: Full=Putative uncharacterized protein UNQ9165/PRO28630; Flags: Precursor [Homo sapiens]AAQ88578.1 AALS9165 [Homo sapiens]